MSRRSIWSVLRPTRVGRLDDHNFKLNNLWGLTKAGHDNLSFPSIEAGNLYFAHRIGPHIQGVETIPDFFAGLQEEGYNSKNLDYFSLDPKKGMLYNRISTIDKWSNICGVSL